MQQINEYLHELAPGVYATVFPGHDDLGNSGIVVTEEGVILIDTDVRTVDRVSRMLQELTDKPLKFLINTHHAFDHSSANCIFADQGATIIGSQRCREVMHEDGELNFRRWSERSALVKGLLQEKGIRVVLPHLTFDQDMQIHLGGKTLELSYHGHAHSPGDIIVYLPEDQILFAGDLLWMGIFPNVREAKVPNQIKVVDTILSYTVRYYVPGHGGITDRREDIAVMRDFLVSLYDLIAKQVKEGKTLEDMKALEEPLAKEHPDWSGRVFLTTAIEVIYRSLK